MEVYVVARGNLNDIDDRTVLFLSSCKNFMALN